MPLLRNMRLFLNYLFIFVILFCVSILILDRFKILPCPFLIIFFLLLIIEQDFIFRLNAIFWLFLLINICICWVKIIIKAFFIVIIKVSIPKRIFDRLTIKILTICFRGLLEPYLLFIQFFIIFILSPFIVFLLVGPQTVTLLPLLRELIIVCPLLDVLKMVVIIICGKIRRHIIPRNLYLALLSTL